MQTALASFDDEGLGFAIAAIPSATDTASATASPTLARSATNRFRAEFGRHCILSLA